jgi:stearoyl-CoA desaturase (Delta-9 desaturase)
MNSSTSTAWSPTQQRIASFFIGLTHIGPLLGPIIIFAWLVSAPAGPTFALATAALCIWAFVYQWAHPKVPLFVRQATYDRFESIQPKHLPSLYPIATILHPSNLKKFCLRGLISLVGCAIISGWIWFGYVAMGTVFLGFIAMTFFTTLGIALSYHRDLTHASYRAHPITRVITCALACMALQGAPMHWVGVHLKHHRHTDEEGDPHSPHVDKHGTVFEWSLLHWRERLKAFMYSHMMWLYDHLIHRDAVEDYIRKLETLASFTTTAEIKTEHQQRALIANRRYAKQTKSIVLAFSNPIIYFAVVGAGLIIPAQIWGWQGFVLCGMVRIFVVNQTTFCVNSVCHLFGTVDFVRPEKDPDRSKNNIIIAWLSCGEGNHANHHHQGRSYAHGMFPGQYDIAAAAIRLLRKLRLAWSVEEPTFTKSATVR